MLRTHKINKRLLLSLVFVISFLNYAVAQDTDEDIGTETVTVTKAYTPTIADAFKIKSVPDLNDSIALQKKSIEYSIFSVPVASTFTPAKGQASKVKKRPPPNLYNSYASAGGGNPANLMAKFYTSRTISRESSYTLGLSHNSSHLDVEGVQLDSKFSNSKLDASYKKRDRDLDWGADAAFQHQLSNWYGLPLGVFDEALITGIDSQQTYFMAEAGAHINIEDAYFEKAAVKYRRFWDATGSAENRVIFEPSFQFPLVDENLGINFKVDYVNGSFENADVNNTQNNAGIEYSHLQAGVNPSLTMLRDDLSVELGLKFVYGLDTDANNSTNNFYIYPAITASYRLLNNFAIAYAGIEGDLVQNTYYNLVEKNPFVSPTLNIQPTDKQYDSYIGLRGQIFANLSYNIKGSYTAENRKPLFNLNPQNVSRTDEKGYNFGNSFEVFYDDIKTLGVFGELNIDVNRNFTLSLNGEYYNYNTETGNSAWNLPELKGSLFLDYQIGEQWYLGANLFYIGERQDFSQIAQLGVQQADFLNTIITLDSYFDANAHLGYRVNDQLSFFIKAANIANNNYQRWANTPVQGFQLLGGATYKFDF